jgi:PAS domain S-box-containing protein
VTEARATVEMALDAFVSVDEQGSIVDWNVAAERLLGWTRAQILGKPLQDTLFPLRFRSAGSAGWQAYLGGGIEPAQNRRLEMAALTRDGREIPVEVTVWREDGDAPPRYNAFVRALGPPSDAQLLRNLLASVVESSDDAIITKTLDGIITSWNASAARILGYAEHEAIGRPVTMLIPPERLNEETAILENLRAGRRIEHYETVRVRKDGRRIDVSLTISPVRDASGRLTGASKILRDVTARKALMDRERAAREQAERFNASKDEFLATLSHELRTPLNAILGWSQMLRRGDVPAAEVAKGMEVIERNVRLQTQLVDDLLDMSRIVSGQMRLDVQTIMPLPFVQNAVESLRPLAESKGLRLDMLLDPAAGPVSGDPNRLQQVVWNLVANAIKFTPQGGRIQVVLERVNSHIEINVVDTGIGISPELLPRVFDRFIQADSSPTRRHAGLGLGLAIVRHIVGMHGGQVNAKSSGLGQGSTFRVQLPVVVVHRLGTEAERRHPRSGADTTGETALTNLGGLRVLVVDDETDARELMRRVLEKHGATVTLARSASEALELFAAQKPDVMVSDIGMPDMDGYELMRNLRARGADGEARIPAIALTAFARSEDRTRAMRVGYLAHVAKPVDSAELIATVASIAGRAA